MGSINIIVTNPKNGLVKVIDATKFNAPGIAKTFGVYENAGYQVKLWENNL